MRYIHTTGIMSLLAVTTPWLSACDQQAGRTLVTIADARTSPARFIDIEPRGDSVGDMHLFDQPLLDADRQQIGQNSGICIRTRVGHSAQCQWTLTLENGTIQVAGREFDQGTSAISITGGSGEYTGIRGDMLSVRNSDGTFTQTLRYRSR